MIVTIVGSTGLVGRALTLELLQNENVHQVKSISRKPLGFKDAKLNEILVADLTHLEDYSEQILGDVYCCCLGTTIKVAGSKEKFRELDFAAVVKFANLAKNNNAKNFIFISAAGADSRSSIFYNQVKGETEEKLLSLGLYRLTIFRPGLLMGQRAESRPMEALMIKVLGALKPILPPTLSRRVMTPVTDLVEKMLQQMFVTSSGVEVFEAKDIG